MGKEKFRWYGEDRAYVIHRFYGHKELYSTLYSNGRLRSACVQRYLAEKTKKLETIALSYRIKHIDLQ